MNAEIAVAIEPDVVGHYERVASVLADRFGGIPLVAVYYPKTIAGPAVFSGPVHRAIPHSIPTAGVTTRSGTHAYIACAANSVVWLAHRGAVELCTWAPTRTDPARCAFARILLHRSGKATQSLLRDGLRLVRAALAKHDLDGAPLRDARGGAAVWVPLAGGPPYDSVAAWLHALAAELIAANPDVFTTAPRAERHDRLYLGVTSNHVGRFSALPYTTAGEPDFPVVLPQAWDEFDALADTAVTAATFPRWWNEHGDRFATLTAPLESQRLPATSLSVSLSGSSGPWLPENQAESRGPNIRAALAVLADGQSRTAEQIVREAARCDLLPATTPAHQLYVALIEYVARARGVGRIPQIVQDPDRRFRLNEPADDWPSPTHWQPRLAPHPRAAALLAQLQKTAGSSDPAAFEMAVCDAFAALGFVATHVGGQAAPDGYLDAPLGPLAYRAMLECKTARGTVAQPDAAEAAKYREAYRGRYACLIGPAFPNEQTLASELRVHAVSAWTVDDLVALLAIDASPFEMRPLFEPGFVADRLESIRWEREHGAAKRVAAICEILLSLGWRAQQHAPDDAADAPLLTEEAAMMLVDGYLAAQGAMVSCTRADLQAAFAHLTSPLVAGAVWSDSARRAIVLTRAPTEDLAGFR